MAEGPWKIAHGYDRRCSPKFVRKLYPPTGVSVASTSMQCRDEHNLVAILQFILALTLQLPVSVIDKDQNTRPPEEETNRKELG